MISADPWFMGVTLRTGPDGSVFVSDWSDTGECHTYKPEQGDRAHLQDQLRRTEAAEAGRPGETHRQGTGGTATAPERLPGPPRAADPSGASASREAEYRSARHASTAIDRHADDSRCATPRLRGALGPARHRRDRRNDRTAACSTTASEHVRAWAVRLLCEKRRPADELHVAVSQQLAEEDRRRSSDSHSLPHSSACRSKSAGTIAEPSGPSRRGCHRRRTCRSCTGTRSSRSSRPTRPGHCARPQERDPASCGSSSPGGRRGCTQ